MPHASDIHGKYIPHNTNKPPPEGWGLKNERSALSESAISYDSGTTRKVEADISSIPEVSQQETTPLTSTEGFWTTRKIVIALLIFAILVIGGGVGAALGITMNNNKSSGTADSTTSATSGTTVTTTTATTATTTTTALNPCRAGDLGWSSSGTTVVSSSQVTSISGLYLNANNTLFLVDEYSNSVVWKLSINTSNLTLIAGVVQNRAGGATYLNYPQGVYAATNGDVYVTDYYNHRVQKYINGSTSGVAIAGTNGTAGSALNQFNGLRYVAFDPTETYMYVTDCNNNRIMRHLTNSTSGSNGVQVAGGSGGNSNSTLNYPWGIFYAPSISSDLFITNYYGHSVIRWTPGASSGYFVAGVPGAGGQTPVLLNNPMGIKVDAYMNMYVVDYGNHRVQMFCANSQTGITIAGTGFAGSTATQLNNPRDIVFDSAMNMYVSDTNNNRLQKFNKL